MPLYQYRCKQCNHKFERIVEYMRSHSMRCPRCGGFTQKLVSTGITAITDGDFPYTGKVDKRVGGRPIQGRKDWDQRIKEKGLVPIDLERDT